MTKVGRPPELDSKGDPIAKCLVNVTIPTKLRDYLRDNNINRSKLFTEVVKKKYKNEICDRCYDTNLNNLKMGIVCNDCSRRVRSGTYYTKFHNCSMCNEPYQNAFNLPIHVKGEYWGCQQCQEKATIIKE